MARRAHHQTQDEEQPPPAIVFLRPKVALIMTRTTSSWEDGQAED